MSKKFVLSFFVLILIIAIGLFWQKNNIINYLENKELESMTVPIKDYNIIDNSSGKFLINKNNGLELMVPTGWNVKIGADRTNFASNERVILYSSDFNYRPANGCLAEIMIRRLSGNKDNFRLQSTDQIKTTIDNYNEIGQAEGYSMSIISVDKLEALQTIHTSKDKNTKTISIEIPTLNRVYCFEFVLFSKECDQQFDNLLNTVKIK